MDHPTHDSRQLTASRWLGTALAAGLAVWLLIGVVVMLFSGIGTIPAMIVIVVTPVTRHSLRYVGIATERAGCGAVVVGTVLLPVVAAVLVLLLVLVLGGAAAGIGANVR